MKPYSANGNPNAKEVKPPPTPKNVHVPRPDEGQINELGTILLILVGLYVAPSVLSLITEHSLFAACKFFLSAWLGYLVLTGNNRARWWMVTFSALAAIPMLFVGLAWAFQSILGFIVFVMGLVPLGIAIALVVPPLSHHFE